MPVRNREMPNSPPDSPISWRARVRISFPRVPIGFAGLPQSLAECVAAGEDLSALPHVGKRIAISTDAIAARIWTRCALA